MKNLHHLSLFFHNLIINMNHSHLFRHSSEYILFYEKSPPFVTVLFLIFHAYFAIREISNIYSYCSGYTFLCRKPPTLIAIFLEFYNKHESRASFSLFFRVQFVVLEISNIRNDLGEPLSLEEKKISNEKVPTLH
jgi:hypothetical protein